jgi:hypothetical protein
MELFKMMELDEKLTKVVYSLTDSERSVLDSLEGFDFLKQLAIFLVLKGWKAEEVADLTEEQVIKLVKDAVST